MIREQHTHCRVSGYAPDVQRGPHVVHQLEAETGRVRDGPIRALTGCVGEPRRERWVQHELEEERKRTSRPQKTVGSQRGSTKRAREWRETRESLFCLSARFNKASGGQMCRSSSTTLSVSLLKDGLQANLHPDRHTRFG